MATETLIDPRNLERSRLAVAPEITESRLDDERERDLHAARVFRDARNAAKQGLTVPGLRKELEAYREHRRKRGEQPFQYLKQAIQAEKGKTEVEKIRAFAPLFAGADKIAEAYPPEQRQSFLDHFSVSANPQAAMMQAANLQWVEHATGIPRRDLAEAWPAHRARYAKALGHEGPIDDAGLYGLIGSRLNQQVQFLDSSEKAARAARAAAVQGRSLADALAEARQAAGPEYEKAARQAYADLMARFTDDEIRVANDIFLMQSQVEGADTRQEGETTQGNFFAEYGRMTAEQRIRVLGLVAEQAENQGEQIEGFFNRMGRAFRSGADRFGRSIEAVTNAGVPEVINDILKAGRVPKDFDVEFPGRSWEAITVPNENVTEFRPLTDDERKQLAEQRDIAAGMTALNRDLMSQVPAIRQFIRQESEGFWAGVANASAMAMESLPVMLAAPIAPLSVNFYYQDARGRLDLEAPEASAAAKDRIALATGLISAGIDRLQIGLTFSKLTRANAWLLQQGIPGKLASMGLRAVTVGAAEFGQEIAQDLTLPVLQDFAAALNNDIPHVDWESEMKQLHDSLGDLAAVSLLFGVVGGVGQGVTNYIQRDRVKAALTDRNGLAAFGIDETRAEEIATVAETNPDAAAELLKAATRDIPAEERKANAEAAVERQRREAETVEALRAAGLPGPIVRNAEGKAQFEYQGETQVFDTPEQALEALRGIDKQQSVEIGQFNRQLLEELQQAAPQGVTVEVEQVGRRTLADWAGESAERIEQARERVRIFLKQAGNDMGIAAPSDDIDLSRWFIQGSSRNVYAGELSTIAIELSESATPATVVEEYAEGISKFMRDRAGVAEEKQVGWIRQTEAGTGRRFLQDDLSALSPELRQQAIDEAFSAIAVGYAFGRVTDEQAPSAIRSFLRAFKEFLADVLALARDIRRFRESGQMDDEFRRWLDVATGLDVAGEIEQARIAADADMARQIKEAMTGEGRTFSITPAQDAEYLAAVEAGDTAKAEELFMDAALANPPAVPNDLREAWEIGRKVAGMSDTEAVYSGLVPDWVFNFGHEVTEFYEAGRREETPEFVVGWRRGDLPEGGRSRNYASNEAEPGVSIAYAHRRDDMELNALTMIGVGGRKKVFVEGWAFPKSRWGSDGEIVILNAKEIEPIKKDDSGNVIPLSQRFPSSGQTFAITPATGPLEQAIARMPRNPEDKARVYEKMRDLVADVKSRRSFGRFTDDNARRFAQIRDIALLEAMAKALPREVRGVLIPAFRQVSELTNAEKRAGYIESLLPKIEQALERHISKNYREAIRKLMKRGIPKVSEARTRGSNITAEAAAIFEQAREAMRLTDDPPNTDEGKTAIKKAEIMAEALREQQNDPSLTDEQLAELEGRIAALELFGGYRNADSRRLAEGYALLAGTYSEGREQRLAVLKARRDWRNEAAALILKGLGAKADITDAERTASIRKAEGFLKSLDEGVMEFGLSGSQLIRRLGELTDDPQVAKLLEDAEEAFLYAELAERDANEADSKALQDAMRRIFKADSIRKVTKKLRELTTPEVAPVEKIEGRRIETVSVPISQIEAFLNDDLSALAATGERIDPVWDTLTDEDVASLELEWEAHGKILDAETRRKATDPSAPQDPRARKRTITFQRTIADGQRQTVGEINQLEGLQLWLTMRQPDQAEKLARLGYDDTTFAQLDAWLKPEAKELGLWMVDYIGADAFNVDQIHRAEKGVGLRLVENYFPVRNDVAAATEELSIQGQQIHSGKSVGALKERVSNSAPPAYVNAVAVFLASRAEINFWKSHVSTLRQWGGLIRDERVARAVKAKMGATYFRALDRLLKRIENGGRMNAAGLLKWERSLRSFMSNFALGTLGLRASTLAINTTASLNFTMEIPVKDITRGVANIAKRPEAFKDAFNSPAVRRKLDQGATFETQLARQSGMTTRPTIAQLRKAAEMGVTPINWVDTGSNLLGAAIAYENARLDALDAGMTEEQAKNEGNRAVERLFIRAAQPTTRFGRSEIEARALESPISSLFMLFTSEPRQKLAIIYIAARQLITGKGTYRTQKDAAQALFAAFVIMQSAAFLVRAAVASLMRAQDDEEGGMIARFVDRISDWRSWAYSIATEHLSAVPVVGASWDWAMGKLFDQDVFDRNANVMVTTMQKTMREAGKLFDDEQRTIEQNVESGIRLIQSLGSLIPGGASAAQLGNVADFIYGAASSNDFLISDEDRVRRYKARFNAFKRTLDEEHGKTTVDGKVNKDVQAIKWGAQADWLQSELQGLRPELREAILEGVSAPKNVKEQLRRP